MLEAVQENEVSLARTLIEQGALLHFTNSSSRSRFMPSVLEAALDRGNIEMVQLLVESGILLDDEHRVWEKIKLCHFPEISRYLFDMGAALKIDHNKCDWSCFLEKPETACWFANLRPDQVDVLLAKGATLDIRYKDLTPFLHCVSCCPESIGPLLERGADIEEISRKSHSTAIFFAVDACQSEVVRALVYRGADINARNAWDFGCQDAALQWSIENHEQDMLTWREEYLTGRVTAIMAGHALIIPPLADMIGEYVSR